MRIELASLENGKGTFSHSFAEGELDLNDPHVRLITPPQVNGAVKVGSIAVEVHGKVTARVEVECDRCLKPIELPVDSKFKLEYITPDEYTAHEDHELTFDDLNQTVFNGESIDVDALVREEVLLAVPDHRLCQPDCKGICPVCGSDRNAAECGCGTGDIDPRWAELQKLRSTK